MGHTTSAFVFKKNGKKYYPNIPTRPYNLFTLFRNYCHAAGPLVFMYVCYLVLSNISMYIHTYCIHPLVNCYKEYSYFFAFSFESIIIEEQNYICFNRNISGYYFLSF